mgnify:CR=1 FL=1
MSDCLFCKIASGQIPSRKVYEDDLIYAFHDIQPARPVHFMIIPKKHIAQLYDVTAEDQALMGHILLKVGQLARQEGLGEGFRLIANTGRIGGQEVYHLHFHILGGPEPVGGMVKRPN